jgi:diguanylate cyclase (GGDEF)-like protein
MHKLAPLEERSSLFWTIAGLIGVAAVGVADLLTGSELAFSLFYLIPIVLVTWFSGRNLGFAMGVASTIAWFAADALAGQSYSSPVIRYWNAAIRLSFFVTVILLIPALQALRREKEVARLDDLTGAANRRHLFEVAQVELVRCQRYKHPFTIVFIDLDNFKSVNDQWGHQVGDQLLCAVVRLVKLNVRKTDFLARFGGDEFVLLLPETDQAAARITVSKVRSALMDEMQHYHDLVTFSIGVLTCLDANMTADELINEADNLMYSVKKNGKDAIAYAIHSG